MIIDMANHPSDTAYDVVGQYIKRYWEHDDCYQDVIVSIGLSYNGEPFTFMNVIAHPYLLDLSIEFEDDWWEGERYLKLIGIVGIDKLEEEVDDMSDKTEITALIDRYVEIQRARSAPDVYKELDYQLMIVKAKLDAFGIVTENLDIN